MCSYVRRSLVLLLLLGPMLVGCARTVPARAPSRGDPALVAILERARRAHKLPGAGALQLRDGKITHEAVVGFRSLQSREPLELTDAFHLGSATKAMTAVVAASLVEDGLLAWDRPLSKVFPDIELDARYASVTLSDLASHRAGLPRDPEVSDAWRQELLRLPTVREQRRAVAAAILKARPAFAAHGSMHYSNIGYMILGLAIEEAAKKPFEQVMQERLFDRLHMKSCGFFAPGRSTTWADAPRGHDGAGQALPPGPAKDLPAAYAPAGLVHCNLADWARFANDQIRGANGEAALLAPASYQVLQRAPGPSPYAMGWLLATSDTGRVINHAGSNGFWKSFILIRLEGRRAILFSTNIATLSEASIIKLAREIDALP